MELLKISDLASGSVTGLELTIRTSGENLDLLIDFKYWYIQSFRVRRELTNMCAYVVLFS